MKGDACELLNYSGDSGNNAEGGICCEEVTLQYQLRFGFLFIFFFPGVISTCRAARKFFNQGCLCLKIYRLNEWQTIL